VASKRGPNIHIDDITACNVFMAQASRAHRHLQRRPFENISYHGDRRAGGGARAAKITVSESNDPRSYRVNSDKLLKAGFKPKKTVNDAIRELAHKFRAGALKDEDRFHNLKWMPARGAEVNAPAARPAAQFAGLCWPPVTEGVGRPSFVGQSGKAGARPARVLEGEAPAVFCVATAVARATRSSRERFPLRYLQDLRLGPAA